MSKRIVIKRVNHVVDVFFGEEGWEADGWCRFYQSGKYLKKIGGVALSQEDFKTVKKELGL